VATDRRIRYPILWLVFAAVMVGGAALVTNPDGRLQALGVGLIALPFVLFGLVTLAYYALERWRARGQA
jgi:hypothetical protein